MTPIDAVLTTHQNAHGCGVAKFSQQLAQWLGVPCDVLQSHRKYRHPLMSMKCSETSLDLCLMEPERYDLFLHDQPYIEHWADVVRRATTVYAANPALARAIRPFRPDVIEAFCPSLLVGVKDRAGPRILTFGMAQKIQRASYERLREVLSTERDYSVNLSCAVHEGAPWADTMSETWDTLRDIFGEHARLLGYLADDALTTELARAYGVALFFAPAARANNTTIWAALESGVALVTNLDADSPPELVHDETVLDIAHLTEWPTPDRLRAIRAGGSKAVKHYQWDKLLAILQPATVSA